MDSDRSIFWHQGLFLQPHHFQQNDFYIQAQGKPFRKFLTPFFWGVAEIEIARGALENLSFDVLKGEFIFQDGTYVVFPGNAVLSSRSFKDAWLEEDKPFTVYLGLRKLDESGANVTELVSIDKLSEVTTRYMTSAEPEQIADIYESGPPGQLKKLNLVLKLFWENEKDMVGDYLLLPLAQLERDGDAIRFSPVFVPPAITIQGSEILLKTVKDIRDQTGSRSRQLNEYKAQRGIHTSDFGARDMVFMLALRTLNRYVPMLFHLTEPTCIHPWVAFGLLRQLIGELSSFSSRINVLGEQNDGKPLLGVYNHSELGRCFLAAQSLISLLLDEITAGPDYIVRLVFDGTYYIADLSPAHFTEGNRYYLVVDTEENPQAVLDALLGLAKLGSRESLPLLIARALPGVTLEHLALPPQELPRRAHCLYFQINHHGDQWGNVVKGNNLALYWDNAPDDFKAELMVVGRS
ncbi:MAG: type VI secretion system baseplate subunit TssK [Deltaproteobacteria bacterium]|nr:type VI secretion system baseplate subunit TssK [Deltaproteobacteria bacterium]